MSFFTDNPALFAVHQQSYSPGTLPDGTEPLIFADFKNGVYQIGGVNCAITDIFEENTDFGTYSPSDVEAGVGLYDSMPVLKSALAAGPLADDYSIIMVALADGQGAAQIASVDLPNWDQELEAGLDHDNVADKLRAFVNAPSYHENGPSDLDYPGRFKIGASIAGTSVFMSVDGSGVITGTGGASTLNSISIYAQDTSAAEAVEVWALYPLQDPSSLDELTAP